MRQRKHFDGLPVGDNFKHKKEKPTPVGTHGISANPWVHNNTKKIGKLICHYLRSY